MATDDRALFGPNCAQHDRDCEIERSNTALRLDIERKERQLQEAQCLAQIALIRVGADGSFGASPAFADVFGLERAGPATLGSLLRLVHPLDRMRCEVALRTFENTQGTGQQRRFEHRVRHPRKGLRWLRWSVQLGVSDGDIAEVTNATVQDITDQRAVERRAQVLALIAQRQMRVMVRLAHARDVARETQQRDAEFLRAVLDTVPMGVAVFDEKMRLATWNNAMPDLAEISRSRLRIGLPFEDFTRSHWREHPQAESILRPDERGRIAARRFEQPLTDGRIVLVSVTPRLNGGIVKTYVDVTRFKKTEERLRERSLQLTQRVHDLERATDEVRNSERARSQFLSMMSHDVRTPVNGLLGVIALLADTPLDESQRALLSLARQSGDQLRLLLDDIAQVTHSGDAHISLEPAPVILRDVIDATADFWQATVRANRIVIERSVDPALPRSLVLDPKRFRQLLDNLLSNAVQWCGIHPIRVRAEARGGRLRVTVEDRGAGIAPDLRARLFAPESDDAMASADPDRLRTGGLSLCRRITQAMGGEIGVEPVIPNGSRFWIELPMIFAPESSQSAAPVETAPLATARGGRPRVVVAEDVEANRIVICAMLDSFGCDFTTVPDGAQVVALARIGGADAILMDVQMPVMDGMEATRRIRSLPEPLGSVPIIGVTAHVLPEQREILLASGMDVCLTKPISRDALRASLRAQLARGAPVAEAVSPPNAELVVSAHEGAPIIDSAVFAAVFGPLSTVQRKRLLSASNEDFVTLARELTTCLAAGDEPGARRAMHSLEGVAGNFGATDVMHRLAALRAGLGSDLSRDAEDFERAIAAMVNHSRDLFVRLGLDRD